MTATQPDWIVENEYGFWCPACGDFIAKPGEDKAVMPLSCELCGFPDFEDGPGYFTGEAP
jgi:predicted RNA-binding Zn-ribbon protein involved in translation (DUF1610 family)